MVLEREAEPSLRITADDTFRKVLLLCAASHFERVVTESIVGFVSQASGSNPRVVEFVRLKGLKRQYHTLFAWKANNANQFFGLFGEDFKLAMEERLKADYELATAIRAFVELGDERNRLIHQDLGQYVLEKTSEEIFTLYKTATRFVEALPDLLKTGGSPA